MEGAAPVSLGCSAVLSLLEVDAATWVRVDESTGCGLIQDACAVVVGVIVVLEVVMGRGRVDRLLLNGDDIPMAVCSQPGEFVFAHAQAVDTGPLFPPPHVAWVVSCGMA